MSIAPEHSHAVSVVGVSKKWGTVSAFTDVSFDVPQGEVVALLGPSGAGKSTLLRCVNHLETISAGRIYVHGDLIGYRLGDQALYELSDAEISRQRQKIGMVFQHFNLFKHMTALQNVMSGPVHVLKRPKAEVGKLAMDLLAKVGLKAKADAYPSELSGGQQQRVAIARALAMQPRVLLLDEPTSALDPELAQEVVETIRKLAEEGQTMLIATHDMAIAREVADRVIFMEGGRLAEDAPSSEFFTAPKSDRARQFLARLLPAVH
ncbi:ATP-binding cassette domain-containing protein [Ensifer sp. T173]|uniref:ATP-binding cassette domain-containing protein n=1 Tax=Ensifer canadensis TaxID=555315 RepID=A0AAW4FVB0_9HYPH|nr:MULTISPECIES: amino acid ABC transporter ATP-binding protein [Ensifer]KQU88154.1 ectoine/hydroxyectoine ABC transporter ATP-binding protein EhuA [Ensifer sp. Root31]MBM3095219.1 ATP-binding cassette domain-containing protein [Ensifer canadensis]UBI79485.1 amino acid ABC transporter ATP-binding protein [Ensifer canadensis]